MKVIILKGNGIIGPNVLNGYKNAFKILGHEVAEFSLENGIDENFLKDIINYKADLAIAYGSSGIIKIKQGFLFRCLKIPLVSLYYDCPFFFREKEFKEEINTFSQFYFNFIWDDSFLQIYKDYGFKSGYKTLLALDESKFSPEEMGESKNAICFVGHVKDIDSSSINVSTTTPMLNNFISDVINLKSMNLDIPVLSIFNHLYSEDNYNILSNLFKENSDEFWYIYYQCHYLGSPFLRKYILNRIDGVDIHVYGNSSWNKKNINFYPNVSYGKELSKVYQKYDVNINISSLQLETSINNRVFDVFGSKGFVLSDYKLDMEKLFPDYWDRVTFKNLNELSEKGQYYLEHKKERKEIVSEAYNEIITNHTYKKRVEEIINVIYG